MSLLNIKEYVQNQKHYLANTIEKIVEEYGEEEIPKLIIIQVGDNPASNAYIKGKLADCAEVGIRTELKKFSEDISEDSLLKIIGALNKDDSVTGFIVQLPLPSHIHEWKITEAIDPAKDVDGFSKRALVNPATPQGIVDYLDLSGVYTIDINAVVIGRSNIVGRPIARLLLDRDCNVKVIHSKTSAANKAIALRNADIIVVATGHRNTLTDEDLVNWVAPDCLIIDVGMNRNDEGKLCGDCENVTVCEKTPVPGGVGLLTRITLLNNLMKLYNIKHKN